MDQHWKKFTKNPLENVRLRYKYNENSYKPEPELLRGESSNYIQFKAWLYNNKCFHWFQKLDSNLQRSA